MVRFHTSLLALTFVTGLVLASSDEYQRRDDELFERNFDDLLNERSDTFDEPEARDLLGGLFKIGEKALKVKGRVGTVLKAAKTASSHGGSLKIIGKKLTSSRRIAKQLKPSKKMMKQLKRVAKQVNKNNNDDHDNSSIRNRVSQDLKRAMKAVADADRYLPANRQYRIQVRGLEDDEELSRRDLDVEEVFGREYDLLDERDTFDDLD